MKQPVTVMVRRVNPYRVVLTKTTDIYLDLLGKVYNNSAFLQFLIKMSKLSGLNFQSRTK